MKTSEAPETAPKREAMAKDPLIEIGSFIRTAREQHGLDIDELAARSRIASHHIKQIETGSRKNLPEETFLLSFITKLLKTLKVKNIDKVLASYRTKEGDFILEEVMNDVGEDLGSSAEFKTYFKIYHLYIFIALVFVALAWYAVKNNLHEDLPRFTPQQIQTPIAEPTPSLDLGDEQGEEELNEEEIPQPQEPEKELPSVYTKGSGDISLQVQIKEVAWFQILAASTNKVLFEGDVFPNIEPYLFSFADSKGFVLATGNAGAFLMNDGDKEFVLGKNGQLIKWYYPKSIKKEYQARINRQNRSKSSGRKRRRRFFR